MFPILTQCSTSPFQPVRESNRNQWLTSLFPWQRRILLKKSISPLEINQVNNSLTKIISTNKSIQIINHPTHPHNLLIPPLLINQPFKVLNNFSTWLNISSKDPVIKAPSIKICATVRESSSTKMEECMKVYLYSDIGNWKFNKMDGFGKLYYQSGKIAYEGNWTKDQFQGFGNLLLISRKTL